MNDKAFLAAVTVSLILVLALCSTQVRETKAQTRTFVIPDDYPTIQEAIEKSANGDTIFVRSGIYHENAIDIVKSIAVIGEGSQSTILNLNASSAESVVYGANITTYGQAISVNADNFTLSGFTINTNGGDIRINGNYTKVTNNTIAAPFSADGYYLDISNNTFLKANFKSGWGVNYSYNFEVSSVLSRISGNTIIYEKYNNCPVTFNGKYDVITNNAISGAAVYIVSTPCFFSGNKISNTLDWITVISSNSIITKNIMDSIDFGFGNEGSNNIIFANQITNCGKAYADPSKHFWPKATFPGNESGQVFGNNFVNNFRNLDCSKMAKIDSYNNGTIGNYWSDYNGTDSNGDGIGDTPYIIDSARSDFKPLIAPFNITAAPNMMPFWAQNLNAVVLAMTENASTVAFTINGNITSSQLTNAAISTNRSEATTTVSFIITDQSGTSRFGNFAIPKNSIPYGTKPTVYIDGQLASNQSYKQDTRNHYVWFTTLSGNTNVSIVFRQEILPTESPESPTPKPSPSIPEFSAWTILPMALTTVSLAILAPQIRRRKILTTC